MNWSARQGGADLRTGRRRGLATAGDSLAGVAGKIVGKIVGCCALLLVVGTTAAVLGGTAEAMQLTPGQKAEMKLHYEKATRAYDVQKYTEAVDEYQKAYEIGGDPAMLYNVAQSYRLADQLSEALRFYRRYLQRSPNARNREDVERKIADLEKTVEDRRKAAAAATAPPPVAPPPPVTPPVTPPETPVVEEGGGGARIAGIVIASIGGAALVGAAITGKLAQSKGEELSDASGKGKTFDPSLESSGKLLDKVAIASVIGGGALAITGVILILVSGSGGGGGGEQHASALPMVTPVLGSGLVGAGAVVRF